MLNKIRDFISYFKLSRRRWTVRSKFEFKLPEGFNLNDFQNKSKIKA